MVLIYSKQTRYCNNGYRRIANKKGVNSFLFKKKKGLIYSAIALVIVFVVSFYCTSTSFQNNSSLARTVVLEQAEVDYQAFLEELDNYELREIENDLEIVATKKFDMSILDEFDLVGLDENEDAFEVRYEINYIDNEEVVHLTVTIVGNDEIPVIETIPGLISNNAAGESDIMFIVDGEQLWLSDLTESGVLNETGWFTSLFKAVQKSVLNVAKTVVKALTNVIKPAVRIAKNVAITVLGNKGAAAIGAWALNMSVDENGLYHANVKCWQEYFGYTDLYDTVFNAATSMRNEKFAFDVNGDSYDDYILWAWKGDYLNLGAGAELGIYKRWAYSDDIWIVDKNLAMDMTLKLDYKGKTIIDWEPPVNQWWITAFNPKKEYQDVNRDNLKATYTVKFNNERMYNSFKDEFDDGISGWEFLDKMKTSYSF